MDSKIIICEEKQLLDTINLKDYGDKENFYIISNSYRKAILEYLIENNVGYDIRLKVFNILKR